MAMPSSKPRRHRAALAWEAAGDRARALAEHRAFLNEYSDADGDLPAVADARRRIAALER